MVSLRNLLSFGDLAIAHAPSRSKKARQLPGPMQMACERQDAVRYHAPYGLEAAEQVCSESKEGRFKEGTWVSLFGVHRTIAAGDLSPAARLRVEKFFDLVHPRFGSRIV